MLMTRMPALLPMMTSPPLLPTRPHRGYQHFGGRRSQGYAVLIHSREARRRAARWLVVLGGGGAIVWVSSRQEVPYTKRM
jgi:hypothetical protein